MLNYHCPDFYSFQSGYDILFNLYQNKPQCFYPNVKIGVIYGCFPGCIWNGGGFNFTFPSADYNTIYQYFHWYSDKDVTLQLTFTNPTLQETDVYDRYGNAILEAASHYPNIEVLVSVDCLEKYIREMYPMIKVNKSIIATTRDRDTEEDCLEKYIENLNNYNKIVLPKKYSKNKEFLSSIPKEYRNRFEILATDPCPIFCPNLFHHYEEIGYIQSYQKINEGQCACSIIPEDNPFRHWMYRSHRLSYEELNDFYDKEGFSEIKISGRGTYVYVALQLVPYLIKPEYQKDIYCILLEYYTNIPVPTSF